MSFIENVKITDPVTKKQANINSNGALKVYYDLSSPNTYDLNLDIPAGRISGKTSVNKFGRALDVDSGVTTDIWDGAVSGGTKIWIPPTTARIHNIVSSSSSDTLLGVGANTIQLYGLTSWNTKETSEVISLNGTTVVPTVNSYVIIHRIKVLTFGASGPNVGTITATAQTDATVTAKILSGEGQTQMAIYGVPSVQVAYMTQFYFSCVKNASSLSVKCTLLANPIPDVSLSGFLTKHTLGLTTEGSNSFSNKYSPYNRFSGPVILKLQGNSSVNNTDVSAGFDLILEDN